MSAWDFKFVFSVWMRGERTQAPLCQRDWCTLCSACLRSLLLRFFANDKPSRPISLGLASGHVRYNLSSALSRRVGWKSVVEWIGSGSKALAVGSSSSCCVRHTNHTIVLIGSLIVPMTTGRLFCLDLPTQCLFWHHCPLVAKWF